MKKYTLYLDESETQHSSGKKYFCIGGIIVENSYHDNELTNKLQKCKKRIWYKDTDYNNHILHELEINEAHEKHFSEIEKYNKMFCIEKNYTRAYKEMAYIISDKNITTMGVSLCVDTINNYYDQKISNNKFTICMQLIIENFCHFLIKNNASGTICYEELQSKQNRSIMKKYNQIHQAGTMFYPHNIIQKYITKLEFKNKKENITGLQIADFIPNDLARKHAGMTVKFYKTHKNIQERLYDGNVNQKDRFGNKKIP